ncbi:hypothetical protein N0V87_010651 [Didymella glomerata]|uniref:Glycosyl transferase n=1 Tax=Didymella glomerata TaxID=749621 RepID=A0A9W8WPG2_9PLEO|nr:hypothetical protein N0V87_010651 [Didymella glomerata]
MWDRLCFYGSLLKGRANAYNYVALTHLPVARSRASLSIATAACLAVTLIMLARAFRPAETVGQHRVLKAADRFDDGPIPSIVHYVCIKEDASSVLRFPFASFLAVFAAVVYLKPARIYIHTDFNDTEIKDAGAQGDRWTKVLVAHPFFADLVWNQVEVPTFAGQNDDERISAVQHKSDFVRWDAIASIGGIYLDWDVVPLRPLTPLLNAGFAFVGGRQYGGAAEDGSVNGTINNGAFMTKPNSAMARIVVREQHMQFTNAKWASNLRSVTRIAEHLVAIPKEALILDRTAFAPTHWFKDSADLLFVPNAGQPSPEAVSVETTDPLELYANDVRNRRRRAGWEMDFSSTYLLHAFSMSQYLDYVNPSTILSRTSNFGIATYDVVRKMQVLGYISATGGDDDDDADNVDGDDKPAELLPEHEPPDGE